MGKRKEDESGPSFWEKVHMALSSAKILYGLVIPLLAGMSAYGTSDTVRNAVHRYIKPPDVPVADVVSPTDTQGEAWQAQVSQSIASIIAKLEQLEKRETGIEATASRRDNDLQAQIDALKAWHE